MNDFENNFGKQVVAGEITGSALFADNPLCSALVKAGRLRAADADRALRLKETRQSDESIGNLLLQLGLVSDRDLAQMFARLNAIPVTEKRDYPAFASLEEAISANFLKQHRLLVFTDDEEEVVHAIMVDPTDRYVVDALELITGKPIRLHIGIASEIDEALQEHFLELRKQAGGLDEEGAEHQLLLQDDVEQLKEQASEAPVIKLVNQIIQRAVTSHASDIHIEPFERVLKIRYRIDGLLRETEHPSSQMAPALISRVKIMANLNIAVRRLPQDGRFKIRVMGNTLDLRVSTVPTLHGESMVMRLLQRDEQTLDFQALGFESQTERRLLEILDRPHGIVVVTGPTGSGKTTTLYSVLSSINKPDINIITIEDPVEYQLKGIRSIFGFT